MAFHHIAPKQLKFVRWTERAFKDWGNCGKCTNCAVTFTARVPLWSYSESAPLYGDFTTETWRQYYLTKDTGPDERIVFKGYQENQIVLWRFRHENRFLPQHEWDKIDAPAVKRRLNFHPEQVKLVKDMDSHITYVTVSNPKMTIFKTIQLCRQQQQEVGSHADLLTEILNVQVRNEDKIT